MQYFINRVLGKLEEPSRIIRNLLFKDILDHANLPRESASAFKAGFHKIIIRKIISLSDRNHYIIVDDQQTQAIRAAITKAMSNWKGFEIIMMPNIHREIAAFIDRVIND